MIGQSSVTYEQPRSSDVVEFDNLNFSPEAPDISEDDSVALFLEEHGYKSITGHDGEAVTVEYAYYNCEPFRKLVDAIGEAALGASAPKLPEEKEEKETEEIETEDEMAEKENKVEQNKEAKMSEKKSDNAQQDKMKASKQESQEVDQSRARETSKQEVVPPSNSPAEVQVPDSNSNIATASIPASPLSKIETTAQPLNAGARPPSTKTKLAIMPKAEPDNVSFTGEQSYKVQPFNEGEKYRIPALEIKANSTDAELHEVLVEDSEFDNQPSLNEFQQPLNELLIDYLQEEKVDEGFILETNGIQHFDSPEDVSESSKIVYELSAQVEEIEQTILELAERMQEIEAEEVETAHLLLNNIVLKAEEARTIMQDETENQAERLEAEEVEEDLKELFVQLFEHIEIEYTPELIDSYVKLVANAGISDLILSVGQEEETNTSHDRGTHEVIKQLLTTINGIKKTTLQAYCIGKSALCLYSKQLVSS